MKIMKIMKIMKKRHPHYILLCVIPRISQFKIFLFFSDPLPSRPLPSATPLLPSPQLPMRGGSFGDAAGLEGLAHELEHGGVLEK
jgi:hypothetical protein